MPSRSYIDLCLEIPFIILVDVAGQASWRLQTASYRTADNSRKCGGKLNITYYYCEDICGLVIGWNDWTACGSDICIT